MLKLIDITKNFGDVRVLRGVSLEISAGEVVGLLGLNGAGKTTLMRIMTGFLAPTSGRVELDGICLAEHPETFKSSIGYLPEQAPAYHDMRVVEFLNFVASAYGISGVKRSAAVEQAIADCRLDGMEYKLCGQLSKGYRHRLGLAQAIVHNPQLLILDEPTDGLDPVQKLEAREMIVELGRKRSVVVSTHLLDEVASMCTRAVILRGGIVAWDGKSGDVTAKNFTDI